MTQTKTVLITGASTGMGYYTAKTLALQGNEVIAAVRNISENRNKIDSLNENCKKVNPQSSITFMGIDLADIESVFHSVERIQKHFEKIDTLICNAGVMNPPWTLTDDKFELQFQTNFLSHFQLTLLLHKQLLLSSDPRVINICSASAENGKIDNVNELERISHIDQKSYNARNSYRESKLAQLISVFAFNLHPDWQKVKFSAVHPGIVNSPLLYRNHGVWFEVLSLPVVWAGYATGKLKSISKGAQTAIWLATKETAEIGYWHDKKRRNPNPIAENESYGKAIIDHYKKVLGIF